MGFNTTVLFMNDAVHAMKDDPHFAEKLEDAILHADSIGDQISVPFEGFANYVRVIETHHADIMKVMVVGGNDAQIICSNAGSGNMDMGDKKNVKKVLRAIAEDNGFRISIKEKKI